MENEKLARFRSADVMTLVNSILLKEEEIDRLRSALILARNAILQDGDEYVEYDEALKTIDQVLMS